VLADVPPHHLEQHPLGAVPACTEGAHPAAPSP
jgi:hypothetical protein